MAYTREIFQKLAELRLAEARLLVRDYQPSGAYYLAGYAIECALKARIAAQFHEGEIPERALINRVYTHDLPELVRLAGLETELKSALEADRGLDRRWSVVKKWSEHARYLVWTEEDASDMMDAIDGADGESGLFEWLTSRW